MGNEQLTFLETVPKESISGKTKHDDDSPESYSAGRTLEARKQIPKDIEYFKAEAERKREASRSAGISRPKEKWRKERFIKKD